MIRPVARDDLEPLRDISRRTFVETFAKDNRPEDVEAYVARAFSAETMHAEWLNASSSFHFAETEDGIGGYLKLNWGGSQTEDVLKNAVEVERIYVLNAFQGVRLGKNLFDFAVSTAGAKGGDWLWLGVWERNEKAIAFYERQGLEVFDEHTFLFGDTPQRDVLMRMKLNG